MQNPVPDAVKTGLISVVQDKAVNPKIRIKDSVHVLKAVKCMKKLTIKVVSVKNAKSSAGCGKNWLNLCGARQGG